MTSSNPKRTGRPPGTWWVEPLLQYMADNPDASQGDAQRAFGLGPSTVSSYAHRHPDFAKRLAEVRRSGSRVGSAQLTRAPSIPWWVDPLLSYMRDYDVSVYKAAKDLGIESSSVATYAHRNPDFAARLADIQRYEVSPPTPRIDAAATAAYLDMLHLGHTKTDAAELAGITRHTCHWWRSDPQWAEAEASVYTRARGRRELVKWLRHGRTLQTSATLAGVPMPTVKRWRRTSPEFDALVTEAAADGGRHLSPYPRPECPGPQCGTTTGYDYGCREDACTTAKTTPILTKRKERQDEH